MMGNLLELTFRDGDESFEVRVDGRCIARIDRMEFEALVHGARMGEPTPWLEVLASPSRKPLTERLK